MWEAYVRLIELKISSWYVLSYRDPISSHTKKDHASCILKKNSEYWLELSNNDKFCQSKFGAQQYPGFDTIHFFLPSQTRHSLYIRDTIFKLVLNLVFGETGA